MKVVWGLGALGNFFRPVRPCTETMHCLTGLKKFPKAPRLLSYDYYDLPVAESEREIERIFFFRSFQFDLPNGVLSTLSMDTRV